MKENMNKNKKNANKRTKIGVSTPLSIGIDDYYLWIYPDVPERCATGIVGFVGSKTTPQIKISIEINLQWMFEHNYVTMALWYNEDDYREAGIVMTPRYFDEFRRTPYLQFELWHEVGHYHTLKYFSIPHDKNGSTNNARMEFVEQGEIMPAEKAADVFGLYYTSKEDAMQALSEAIRRRRTYFWESQEITQKAVEEFRQRKRFLREIDTDDKARAVLCQLCGKTNYLEI